MIFSKKSFYIIILLIIAIDQISKYYVLFNCQYFNNITPFLNIVAVKNYGVSFGLFNFGIPIITTRIILSLLVIVVITYLIRTQKKNLPFALIIGGAIGNLIDRIFLGFVIDFIDIFIGTYHWPAFNVADSAICFGAFLYLINNCHKKDEKL